MTDVAALIAEMIRAGIDPDLIGRTAATIADASTNALPARTARQERNKRYYENKKATKASEKRLKASETSNSDDQDALLPPEGSSPTPPSPNPLSSVPPSPPKGGSSPTGFDRFWDIFPNKVGKRDAKKAFAKALQRATVEEILAGAERYAAKTDDRPWCNPATFLNQDRWGDMPAEMMRSAPRPRAPPPIPQQDFNSILDAMQGKPHVPQHSGPTIDASYERRDRGGVADIVQFHAVSARR